jgi:hypothetical protein
LRTKGNSQPKTQGIKAKRTILFACKKTLFGFCYWLPRFSSLAALKSHSNQPKNGFRINQSNATKTRGKNGLMNGA